MLRLFVNKTDILINLSIKRYAGHSKWANIKHTKALKDGQKAAQFQKLTRLMRIAITEGGSVDPNTNVQLSQVIEQAKRASMPNSNIQNVLKSVDASKDDYRKHILEIKGPNRCLILVELFTSNITKARHEIAAILKKTNYAYADSGVMRNFDFKGLIDAEQPSDTIGKDENILKDICTEHAIMAGAEDVEIVPMEDNKFAIRFICHPNNVMKVEKALKDDYGYTIFSSSSEYVPLTAVKCTADDWGHFEKFCTKLDNISDVVNVYNNLLDN